MIVPNHGDCVVCNALAHDAHKGAETKVLLLFWIEDGVTLEMMVAKLCFSHRRELQEAVKK